MLRRRIASVLWVVACTTGCEISRAGELDNGKEPFASSDIPLAWAVTAVWAVGGADESTAQLSRVLRQHVAIDDMLGQPVVLDVPNRRVLVLTRDGRLSHFFGIAVGPGV